jgi:hypothetical protein
MQRQAERHGTMGLAANVAERNALANLCHVLLATNEFLYVP